MEHKTHYRKIMKSDHLGVADLEEFVEEKKSLIFTIKEVKQHVGVKVAGRKIDANIAYFVEPIKPMVLNSINSKVISSFNNGSGFIEDWANTKIELYIDEKVSFGGELTGGIRIKKVQPIAKVKPNFTEANFEKAAKAKATIAQIEAAYTVADDVAKRYEQFVSLSKTK